MKKIICDQCECECAPKTISLKNFNEQEINFCSNDCFWKWVDDRNRYEKNNKQDELTKGDLVTPIKDGIALLKNVFVFIGRAHNADFICVDEEGIRHIFKKIALIRSGKILSSDQENSGKKNSEIKICGWISKDDFANIKFTQGFGNKIYLPDMYKRRGDKKNSITENWPPVHVEIIIREIGEK